MTSPPRTALIRFLLLYATLYAGFGVQSPFLPSLLAEHGLGPGAVGMLLAAAGAVRLLAGPAAGRLADRLAAARPILIACAGLAAGAALLYPIATGFFFLLIIVTLQAAALAPLAPLTDTLVLGTAGPASPRSDQLPAPPFAYGSVRGAGSAAFVVASILSGAAAARLGLGVIVWLQAALLASAALCACLVSPLQAIPRASPQDGTPGVAILLRLAPYRRIVLLAALVLGSHALHDGFAVIIWREAGIGTDMAGLLWAEAVAAEVVMFLALGGKLLARLGPAGCAMLAAGAAAVRWGVMAETARLPALLLIQPLHGLTFALLHLAAMRLMAEIVPPRLAATALTLYGTVGIGAATTVLTLASGPLYAGLGAGAFWVMAALCVAALPVAATLRSRESVPEVP
jgi:PPP family 3-phenylpropionic acid transporter